MSQLTPSDKAKRRINKLNTERLLLEKRANALRKEKNPYIVTREHKANEQLLSQITKRIHEIDYEIRKERHFLTRQVVIDSAEIESNTISKTQKRKNISDLESYINRTIEYENMYNTPPPKSQASEDYTISQSNNPTSDTRGAASLPITSITTNPITTPNTSTMTSAPNFQGRDVCGTQDVHSTPTSFAPSLNFRTRLSTIVGQPPNYELPPNYETAAEKESRLRQEREKIEQLNKDAEYILSNRQVPGISSMTGAIRKNTNARFPDTIEEENIPANSRGEFHNYIPTPERSNHKESSHRDHFYNNGQHFEQMSRPRVSFVEQPSLIPNDFDKQRHFHGNVTSHNDQNIHISRPINYPYNITPIFGDNSRQNDGRFDNRVPYRESFAREHSYRDASGVRETYLKRLKHIPKFNGDSFTELKEFINKADTLYNYCSNDIEEDEFYQQMIFQLAEEPKDIIVNMGNPEWTEIKEKLLKHYSYLANKDLLASQIENLHQEKGESIIKYSERARKLLKERNSTYSHMSEDLRRDHNKTALRAFTRGLRDAKLKEKLSIRGSDSLESSIAYALEAESESLREIPNYELYCRFCRVNGHRERECRRKNGDDNDLKNLASALRSLNMSNPNNFRNDFRNNSRNQNFGGRFRSSRFNNNFHRQNMIRMKNDFRNWTTRNNNNPINSNYNNNNNNQYNRNFNDNNNGNFNRNFNSNMNQNANNNDSRPNNTNNNNNNQNRGNYRNERFGPNDQYRPRSNNFATIFEPSSDNNHYNDYYDSGNA